MKPGVLGVLVLTLAAVMACPVRGQAEQVAVQDAVEQLAGQGDAARDKARRRLLAAGARAIQPLEDAAWGDDAELAFEAGRVLRMIELGVDPETPEDIRKLAEGFHEPDNKTIRPLILRRLAEGGEHGLQSIRAMVLSERDENIRARAFGEAAEALLPELPEHVLADEMATAEAILWIWAGTGDDSKIADLAAFVRSTDRMADALAVARNWSEGLASPFRCTLHAFLERAAGDEDAAIEAARRSGQSYLVHVLLIEAGKWPEFATTFREFLASRANVQRMGYLLSAHRLAGNEEEFNATIDRVLQFARRDEDSVGLAAATLLFNGKPDMAVDLLALHGEYDTAVQIRLTQGQPDKAEALVDKWRTELAEAVDADALQAEADGTLPDEALEYAGLLMRLDRRDEALPVLKSLAGAIQDETPLFQKANLASMLHRAGAQERAAGMVLAVLEDPEVPDGARNVLLGTLVAGRNLEVFTLWESLRALDPDAEASETLEELRGILRDDVTKEDLSETVETCIEFARENPHLWAQGRLATWARLCEQRGMMDSALQLYRVENELFSTTGALQRAAMIAREMGRNDEAVQLSARAFEADTKTPISMFLRSVTLRGSGRKEEADKLLHAADATALARLWQRGNLALLMERYEMPDAANQQREVVVQAGRFVRLELTAADLYASHLRDDGRLGRARWLMEHQALGMLGRGAQASVEVLMSGYEYRPIYQVIELLREGDADAATAMAREIMGRAPGLADSLILLINTLDKHGQVELADELFEKMWKAHQARRELFPGVASHYNTQAWVGSRCGRKLDECLELSLTSLEMDPYSPYFLDTLADIHFMRGDAEKALDREHLSVNIEASSFTWRQYHRFRKGLPED